MDEAINDRGSHIVIPENGAPPGELQVGGDDQATSLIPIGDDLEQQPGPFGVDGEVAELVNDDQLVLGDRGEFLIKPVLFFSSP